VFSATTVLSAVRKADPELAGAAAILAGTTSKSASLRSFRTTLIRSSDNSPCTGGFVNCGMAGFAALTRACPSNPVKFALHSLTNTTALNRNTSIKPWLPPLIRVVRSCTPRRSTTAVVSLEFGIAGTSPGTPSPTSSPENRSSVRTGPDFPLLMNGFLVGPNWGNNRWWVSR
jgi:hypothetical protein